MPDAPSAAALSWVPRRDGEGELFSLHWAVCFGASLTDCFETDASLCLGFPDFLLFFLSCILCRGVGMKPVFYFLSLRMSLCSPAQLDQMQCYACMGQELLGLEAGVAGNVGAGLDTILCSLL